MFWARIGREQLGIRAGKEKDCGFGRVVDVVKKGRPEIGGVITRRAIFTLRDTFALLKICCYNISPCSPLFIITAPITTITKHSK